MKRFAMAALALVAALALLATGCGSPQNEPAASPAPTLAPAQSAEPQGRDEISERVAAMSLEEKTGQLFIIRPDSLDLSLSPETINDPSAEGVTALGESMRETLVKYKVGGVAIFGKNIESAEQLGALLADLEQSSPTPLFLAVDEEGGSVARIANSGCFDVPRYESMSAVGESGDAQNAREVGLVIGGYLARIGFNLDFAPDADVNTNPDNPVIGARAFGDDPELVAEMVAAEISGLREAGVMCCIKHYPGHGDTATDTHLGYAATEKTWEELKSCELVPFMAGINARADMVMVAHITAPNVDPGGAPASLSEVLLAQKLRGELGYESVIITDSLAMGAITEQYSSAEAAIAAINAGVDILLMPQDFYAAYDGLLEAVRNGKISEQRIDESVARILALKAEYGLI